ncbi:ORF-92 [Teiidae poxvirus 1]|nr:ORF-92 [Teiidae poxvirus 1]
MDSKFCLLLETIFKGKLTTKDVYALAKYLFNEEPVKTTFSKTTKGNVFIDFIYQNGLSASKYLDIQSCKLEDFNSIRNIVASEITNISFIESDLECYIKQSVLLKKFIKLYKKENTIKKANDVKAQQALLKNIGIDDTAYEFIKDAISLASRK